jgi:hypothetical protein
MTTLTYSRDGLDYTATVEELPATAIAYLLQYGWAQSLQDAIAGRGKAVLEEIAGTYRAQLIEAAKPNDPDPAVINQQVEHFMLDNRADIVKQVAADIAGTLNKRADAIRTGTVGTRVSQPRDAFESMCLKIAGEMLRAALKAQGKKSPKPDAFAELAKQVRAKHSEKIEAEAKRRIESANTIGLDVDIEV